MQLISFDVPTGLEVRFGFEPIRLVSGQPVRWIFVLANRGRERRVVTFTSSQRGEVALAADGLPRYRWSSGKLFAAVICERAVSPGEEWRQALVDTLSLPAGRYLLNANMTSRPTLPPVRGEITVYPAQ